VAFLLDLTTARLFVSVVEETGIARAARREGIAPSAVSKRISELEQRLGVVLLRRHANGVEVTAAGTAVLRRARNLLQEVGLLQSELQLLGSGIEGQVRLAAGETALVGFLPSVLSRFLKANPAVRIQLDECHHAEVAQAVRDGAADIGILPGNAHPPELWTRPLFRDQLVAVMAPDHPLARYPGVTMTEILDHDVIGHDGHGALGTLIHRQASLLGRSLRIRVAADGYDVVCRLAEVGLGIGIVAESSFRRFAGGMTLASLPILDSWARREHRLCTLQSETLNPAARLLLDELITESQPD
jgi:DNA-binding transcriptional LysR family regulator